MSFSLEASKETAHSNRQNLLKCLSQIVENPTIPKILSMLYRSVTSIHVADAVSTLHYRQPRRCKKQNRARYVNITQEVPT